MSEDRPLAIVAGVGPGLGGALCRRLSAAGYAVAGLARTSAYTDTLAEQIHAEGGVAHMVTCELTDRGSVEQALGALEGPLGAPAVLVYNAGGFLMSPFDEIRPEEFDRLWEINCRGAFLCARQVVPRMLEQGGGTIIFTGASASVKPSARFAAFGSSKFALRGLALAMARELGPRGIHVAHVVIDGVIWTPRSQVWEGVTEDNTLQPDAIAETYLSVIRQPRSAWTLELDLRPDVEPF